MEEVEALYEAQHQEPEPTPAPEPAQTAAALGAEGDGSENEGPLTSLHGVNQTPVRMAIRQAKEQKYGAAFKSSEVIANYFCVAEDDGATHRNCFRVVYAVSTTAGKAYLTADLFDLTADRVPTAEEVRLTVKNNAQEAVKTDEFDPGLYTVYVLTEGSMIYAEDGGASPFHDSGLLFPDSLTEQIQEGDVWRLAIPADKTLLQLLHYGRNEIYARCGNKFSDSSEYTRFYSNYSWYQPRGSISFDTIRQQYPVAAENIMFLNAMEQLILEG
jgi:hypothetical protein